LAKRSGALDIVLLYAPPWFGPTRFSKHHLASFFAQRGYRVLYVEAPLTPVGLRRGRDFVNEFRNCFQPPKRVADQLWVRRHFVPVPYHSATWLTSRRAANAIAQRLLAPVIRRDMARLGMRRPVLIAGLPHAADILQLLPRSATVYHCADEYAAVRGFPSTLPEVEADLSRQADLVIATSQSLCERLHRLNPNTHWIPNGADVAHFAQVVEPAKDLGALKRPIVGFIGGLSEWVDMDLMAVAARERPRWTFALVGPIGIDTAVVRSLSNVRLLGPRPYASLPSYLAAMDVAVIPFKRNTLTYHADPIKTYEYLAAGLPVVATDLPALRRLGDLVHLAASPAEFVAQLDAAVAEGRDARRTERQAEAAKHSWSSRFDTVDRLLRDTLNECAS
jgi:glycosyltransferase involved in cell wall biosynthesis